MTYRDPLEAALARIRNLELELEDESELRRRWEKEIKKWMKVMITQAWRAGTGLHLVGT